MKPPSRYPGFWRPAHLVQRRIESLGFEPKHEWLATNLGKELGTIDHETLPPCGTQVTSQGGFELLCSYNWHRRTSWRAQPEIHVPGEAPGLRLQKVPLKTRLMGMGKGKKPKKKSYRDVNSAQSPLSPFEPMFRAVGVMRPAYRFDDVDVVVNRSSLHHLLRLADGGRCKDAFRFDLAMIKNTLIITPLWQRNEGGENYGNIFEEYFTKHRAALGESQSHHRAIRYDLGPLRVAVLYEVDAACPEIPPSWKEANWTLGQDLQTLIEGEEYKKGEVEGEGEAEAVATDGKVLEYPTAAEEALFSSIHKGAFAGLNSFKLATKVTWLGNGTLSAHTAELATMQKFGQGVIPKIPQMWLGRTPYLLESLHINNHFTDVKLTHCVGHLLAYEKTYQPALQRLVTAVQMLKDFTERAEGRHSVAVCTRVPRLLRVFEASQQPGMPLSAKLQRRFWRDEEKAEEYRKKKREQKQKRKEESGGVSAGQEG